MDLARFRVSDSAIEPLPKDLDAIGDFPSPTSTTDVRSWFGLVNQLNEVMAKFKPFFSLAVSSHGPVNWQKLSSSPGHHNQLCPQGG